MKKLILIMGFAIFAVAPLVASVMPQTTYAAQTDADRACERRILTFPTWFRGLSKVDADGDCGIRSPEEMNTAPAGEPSNGLSNFIWRIVLNVIEIGLQLVGYIAVIFIIYGGFQFMTGGGNPGQIEKARRTLLNAVIGLVIALASTGLVNLVFGIIG